MFVLRRFPIKLGFNSNFRFSAKKSPYQILGLKPNASTEQIKKSYRVLAQKYHPDKNPGNSSAQKLFLDVKQAYETLIDEDKRRQYDVENGFTSGKGRSPYGFQKDPFQQFNSDIYKDKSRVYHETYTAGPKRARKGDDLEKQVKISFLDSVKGVRVKLDLQRKDTCTTCGGSKCEPGTAPTRCLSCGGSGTTFYRKQSMTIHLNCPKCHGHGVLIKNPCIQCKATGIKVVKVQQQIQIPAGIDNGEKLTLKQKGNHSQNGPNGDLQIKLTVEKHPKFRRVQNSIETTEWITISQAALGAKKNVDTIWGQKQVSIKPGSQDGSKIKIRGQGIKKGVLEQGDHLCVLRIKIPTSLTQKQRQIFEQLSREDKNTINPNEQNPDDSERKQKQESETANTFQKFKDMFK